MASWVSKDAEFCVDFKNMNFSEKMHLKGYSRIKNFFTTQGAPYIMKNFFFLE
jgi:hypothetical protein